ncbi:transglutaminase family protein [Nitrospirota bacterium]
MGARGSVTLGKRTAINLFPSDIPGSCFIIISTMLSKEKIIFIAITVVWLGLMGLLIERFYVASPVVSITTDTSTLPEAFLTPQWMGIYMNGSKIGYNFTQFTQSADGYDLTQGMRMNILVMGFERSIQADINATLNTNLRLMAFNATVASEFDISVSGKVVGNTMRITLDTGSGPEEHSLRLSEQPSLEPAALMSILAEGRLTPGEKIRIPVIEPTSMTVEDTVIEVLAREPVSAMGEMHDTFKLRSSFKGIEIITWLTPKGEILRQESSAGFTLMREGREEATALGQPSLDMIYQTSVPFNLELPRETEYLKVEISGISLKGLQLDGGRQKLNGNVLEIRRESPRVKLDDTSQFLGPSMTVQSGHPDIKKQADKINDPPADAETKARRLNDWVFKAIEKVPVITLPSATQVLANLRGDCNEHTVLYTALARASGIPTRMAAGLVYKDKSFYYHAWPEVYLGAWVAVDPTFGQFPADASHIRLVIGDLSEQIRLIPSMGKIELKGIEYR